MANASYSIALSAIDKFSAPFKTYQATSEKLTADLRGQQAELRQLNTAAGEIDALGRIRSELDMTSVSLEKSRGLERELGLEKDRLTQAIDENNTSLTQARHEHTRLTEQVKLAESPSRDLLRQQREAAQAVKALERDHKSLNRELGSTTKAQDKAALKTAQLSVEHRTQTNRLKSLEASLSKAGVDTGRLADEQKRLRTEASEANDALKVQQARLKSVSDAKGRMDANRAARADLRGQVLETAAMGYLAAQPIMAAVNYESSMADVKKVVNFEDDAEAAQMGRDILKMSTEIPMAASGIAEIVSAAGQSGVAKAELLDFATSAAKMATAFDVSAEDAGSTMAAWRASMGLSQGQAVALADATNYLSNNMNAQAKDIAGVLKRQGAVAMSAGLNETQTASLSAALLSGGAGEEVAATALKNITGALMKGDTGSAAQQSAWTELGFDPNQLAGDMMTDAPNTMIKVFEAMQDVPEEQVSALVSTLFGEEAKGSVMPMLKNLDNLRSAFDMTSDATKYRGSMEDEYRARSATTANEMQLLSSRFERLQISVGTLLLPALNTLMEPLAAGAELLTDFAETFPTFTKWLTIAGVGLVGIKTAVLALKMVGLQFGQGVNVLRLGRAKLSATTGDTAKNATLADRALRGLNNTMARMSRRRSAMGGVDAGVGYSRDRSVRTAGQRPARIGRGGRFGRLAGLAVSGAGALLDAVGVFGGRSARPAALPQLGMPNPINAAGTFAPPVRSPVMGGVSAGAAGLVGLLSSGAGAVFDSFNIFRSSRSGSEESSSAVHQTNTSSNSVDERRASTNQTSVRTSREVSRDESIASRSRALTSDIDVEDSPGRFGRLGKFGRVAGLVSGGAALSMISSESGATDLALAGADATSAAGEIANAVPMLKAVGKVFKPLNIAFNAAAITSSVSSGDYEEVGSATGDMVGGLGGAAAGAMAGAAIGSVVPVLGTAVGGLVGSIVGGFGGGALGEWAGGKVGSWFADDKLNGNTDRLPSPDKVHKEVTKNESKRIVFAPSISMPASSGDIEADKRLIDALMERMKSEFVPLMAGGDLSVRMDATLMDGGEV